jgi:hypothetical protein
MSIDVDFRIKVGLYSHPKFLRLIAELGPAAGMSLHMLWAFAAANRRDGELSGLMSRDVELAARWAGEPGKFVETLLKLKWLTRTKGRVFQIHDWQEHQPWIAGHLVRCDHARRAAKSRWRDHVDAHVNEKPPVNAEESACSEQCSIMLGACSEQCPSPFRRS